MPQYQPRNLLLRSQLTPILKFVPNTHFSEEKKRKRLGTHMQFNYHSLAYVETFKDGVMQSTVKTGLLHTQHCNSLNTPPQEGSLHSVSQSA